MSLIALISESTCLIARVPHQSYNSGTSSCWSQQALSFAICRSRLPEILPSRPAHWGRSIEPAHKYEDVDRIYSSYIHSLLLSPKVLLPFERPHFQPTLIHIRLNSTTIRDEFQPLEHWASLHILSLRAAVSILPSHVVLAERFTIVSRASA